MEVYNYIFFCYFLINKTLAPTQRERIMLSVFENRVLTEILWYKVKLHWNVKMHNTETCELQSPHVIHGVIKSRRMESR